MSEADGQVQVAFVILTKPTDPTSLFTTDLGDGRTAVCVFSEAHHALLFAKNAQGIDPTGMSPMDPMKLRQAIEARKLAGATHVLLNPSAGAGEASALEIDEFLSSIKV